MSGLPLCLSSHVRVIQQRSGEWSPFILTYHAGLCPDPCVQLDSESSTQLNKRDLIAFYFLLISFGTCSNLTAVVKYLHTSTNVSCSNQRLWWGKKNLVPLFSLGWLGFLFGPVWSSNQESDQVTSCSLVTYPCCIWECEKGAFWETEWGPTSATQMMLKIISCVNQFNSVQRSWVQIHWLAGALLSGVFVLSLCLWITVWLSLRLSLMINCWPVQHVCFLLLCDSWDRLQPHCNPAL